MYIQIWNKYLPVIKILLKRAAGSEQSLALDVSDFEKAAAGRKTGYKFNIHFSRGRVDNVIGASPIAKDLAFVLLQDKTITALFVQNDYHVTMNTKFQLGIKMVPSRETATEAGANPVVEETPL